MMTTQTIGLILYVVAGIAVATGVLVYAKATVETSKDATAVLINVIGWPILLMIMLPVLFARLIRARMELRKPAPWNDEL